MERLPTRWLIAALLVTAGFGAIRAAAQENPLGFPAAAVVKGGSLVISGGGQLPDEVYDEFVRIAGGEKARLVLVPSAYNYGPRENLEQRFAGWRGYRCESFDFIDAKTREESDSAELAEKLASATGVWFSGGDQGRLADLYRGTAIERAVIGVLERGGVVGGTSAGSSIMSQTMIRYGTSSHAVLGDGFGLLSKAVIDQHFSQRARHTRLLNVVRSKPGMVGIGVDEGTALIVSRDKVRTVGSGGSTVMVPDAGKSMRIYMLEAGDEADLVPRSSGLFSLDSGSSSKSK